MNKPEVSKAIAWTYGSIVIFIGALMVFLAYAGFSAPIGAIGIVALIVLAFVETVMLLLSRSVSPFHRGQGFH